GWRLSAWPRWCRPNGWMSANCRWRCRKTDTGFDAGRPPHGAEHPAAYGLFGLRQPFDFGVHLRHAVFAHDLAVFFDHRLHGCFHGLHLFGREVVHGHAARFHVLDLVGFEFGVQLALEGAGFNGGIGNDLALFFRHVVPELLAAHQHHGV